MSEFNYDQCSLPTLEFEATRIAEKIDDLTHRQRLVTAAIGRLTTTDPLLPVTD